MTRMRMFCYVLILALCVPMVAVAAGGGGGKKGGGNEEPGIAKGDLYGDPYRVVRDSNGAPIPYVWTWEFAADGETLVRPLGFEAGVAGGFPQPIADESEIPDGWPWWNADLPLVPLDPEGHVPEAYADYTVEVELGRLNLARAGSDVIDRGYAEALKNITAADSISLDPAGRLVLHVGDSEKTIDSPRENLGLYRELMRYGYLPGLVRTDLGALGHLRAKSDGTNELDSADLYRAACFFAGAADKFSDITLDKVIYTNSFLGLNDPASGTYYDFGRYSYRRLPAYDGMAPLLLDDPVTIDGQLYFGLRTRNIMAEVFGDTDYQTPDRDAGARAFTKAADDAVHTIWFIHNWAVPEFTQPE
ncbi:MAG: hypothetical protein Q7W44_07605 [Coriobacteriia bacterium]|nr:hypothetical protein [Coriobacteriia bacterium]